MAGVVLLTAVLSVATTWLILSSSNAPDGKPSRYFPITRSSASNPGPPPTPTASASRQDTLSTVTVLLYGDRAPTPFGIKVGSEFIELKTPADIAGDAGLEHRSWRAGLIDTADLLRANGYSPETPFAVVVGGRELTAGNTYRITGSRRAEQDYADAGRTHTVVYESMPGEQGVWRTLKFRNFMLSYGYAPGLRHHLVAERSTDLSSPSTIEYHPSTPQDAAPPRDPRPITAADYPNPRERAAAIMERITESSRQQAALMPTLVEGLRDNNGDVREVSLGMMESLEGPLPLAAVRDIALHDSEPALRIHALDLLVDREGPHSLTTLKEARMDPDPTVSQTAEQIIDNLSSRYSVNQQKEVVNERADTRTLVNQ